jgi:hypothetical protein
MNDVNHGMLCNDLLYKSTQHQKLITLIPCKRCCFTSCDSDIEIDEIICYVKDSDLKVTSEASGLKMICLSYQLIL